MVKINRSGVSEAVSFVPVFHVANLSNLKPQCHDLPD